MPGLNQLKQFSEDIRTVGDEVKIRAQRGEKPVVLPLPENISAEDDSDDFLIGLPEPASEDSKESVDVSALISEPTVDVTDIDSILEPSVTADDDDLAEFLSDDLGVPSEPAQPEKPEEITPLEDMDLDALLSTNSSGEEINLNEDIPADVLNNDGIPATPITETNDNVEPLTEELGEAEPAGGEPSSAGNFSDLNDALSGLGDLSDLAGMDSFSDSPDSSADSLGDLGSFDIDSLISGGDTDTAETPSATESFADNGIPDFIDDAAPASDGISSGDLPEADLSGLDLSGADLSGADLSGADLSAADLSDADLDAGDLTGSDLSGSDLTASDLDAADLSDAEELSGADLAAEDLPGADLGGDLAAADLDAADLSSADMSGADLSADDLLGGAVLEEPPFADNASGAGEEGQSLEAVEEPASSDGDLSDAMKSMDLLGGFDQSEDSSDGSLESLGSFDIDSLIDEESSGDGASSDDGMQGFDGGASLDFDSLAAEDPMSVLPDASMDVPSDGLEDTQIETFDTTGMEDVDFGSGSSDSLSGDDFPSTDEGLSKDDDFVLDSSFEIPGFSDTETADFGKKKSGLDIIDFSKGKEGRPKNSLTDEEYVQFKKNLANYPLNLRIAIEDFIARDEFTDDAIFEVIEKVLKKVSARQLATQLEKILDISISIPRDFERRSFAEYEAYKQSFQYQLRNRIIPAAIVGVILCFVCFGLFKAGQHFIYKPVMASINYKQGYTLLEENEFPQSEEKFWTAVSYKPVKNWFFKYALGYREKKQFERSGQMYKNILRYFNQDKMAGLEYAEMELYDRANYERAEEIVRREVLDYHINDADGILLLGDVFLEWAEVDPSKYELAKQQYLDLIQRYGGNNVYLSRMLRYNIRTDKLRDVLTYKNMFYVSKQDKQNLKNLGASDWRELSGYLLDKLYGTLSKNDEYLRSSIEDVLAMLNLAIKSDPANPVGHYNLARYFIHNGNTEQAKVELEHSLELFDDVPVRTKKNVYREINATRVLGELYAGSREYLKAQTLYTRGINLYNEEHEAAEFEGDANTGKLFADMGDLDYFISGEMEDALYNYEKAIEIKNDTPSINYRVGSIYYGKKDYDNALVSFIKVSEKEPRNPNVLLSLGNVLSLRGDNFAAESYYSDLLKELDQSHSKQKVLLPQSDEDDYATVDLYLKANNNLGVTLYRLAHQTGNSNMNAEAMVRLSDSIRAWDALTRNQQTMIRMEGSNLAAQNSKYITHPYPEFEPAIYTDIPRLLSGEKGLE